MPHATAQNTFRMAGGRGSPLAVMQSITMEPESDEVTKYRAIPNIDVTGKKIPMPFWVNMTSNLICSMARQDNLTALLSVATDAISSPMSL